MSTYETDTIEAMLAAEVHADETAAGLAAPSRDEVEKAGRSNVEGVGDTERVRKTCGGCRG